jgi:hypothetical protein
MGLGLLLLGPPVLAQDKPKEEQPPAKEKQALSPEGQYKAIVAAYDKAMSDFFTEYQKAKTDSERNMLVRTKYPSGQKEAKQILELAKTNPKEAFAIDALLWVIQHDRGPGGKPAMDILLRDHLQSPKMVGVVQFLMYSGLPGAEQHLRDVLEKNPDKNVQGMACFGLAQVYKRQAETQGVSAAKRDEAYKQVEQYCNRIIADFADVKSYRPLGQLAKSELFEIQHLRIGLTAPDITGEDLDGKKFSLADYRGKVVVLDFWGNW